MTLLAQSASPAGGSNGAEAGGSSSTSAASKKWTSRRSQDGHPDLQGTWANNNVTPLERPKLLAGREFPTDEEVAALHGHASDSDAGFGDAIFVAALKGIGKYKAGALGDPSVQGDGFDAATGSYKQFWLVTREFDNRTSLIVEPPTAGFRR